MKVLLIHPRLVRLGGLEARLFNYADYFISKGHEVHIACRRAVRVDTKPEYILHKFPVIFTSRLKKNFYFNQKLERWNKPLFDFELSLGRTTIQPNILAPATHEGFVRGLGRTTLSAADKFYIEMDKRGYDASTNIFAASGKVRDEILEFYSIPPEKIHVLYPPFNMDKHVQYSPEQKASIRKKYGFASNKIYHLFVSSSHDLKGLPLLNNVFEKLKDTPHILLVIGKAFQSKISNVISMGYFNEISEAYALGDYLLHPSHYDAFAQVVTEALHHQIPIVVSPNTGAKEIITPTLGLVASDREVETWVEIIETLPERKFSIPSTLIADLGLDLDSHIRKMLEVNGIEH